MDRLPRLLALAVLATVGCDGVENSGADSGQASSIPDSVNPVLTVRATDYAYVLLPDSIASGVTKIVLKNEGKQRHELALGRLRPGVSASAVFEVAKTGGDPAAVVDSIFGILVAMPGTSSPDTLILDLEQNRTYAIVCFLRDAPDKPEHVALGMFASFVVKP